jgi:hypothetical protein
MDSVGVGSAASSLGYTSKVITIEPAAMVTMSMRRAWIPMLVDMSTFSSVLN